MAKVHFLKQHFKQLKYQRLFQEYSHSNLIHQVGCSVTVKKKFDAVLVAVATRDDDCCSDLTNIVHMTALKTNTNEKQTIRMHSDAW